MKWYTIKNQQIELLIFVKPNAKKSAILATDKEELHISLHAKPHDNEANEELIYFLAKFFRVPKTQVVLLSGERSRHKKVLIPLNEEFFSKFIS